MFVVHTSNCHGQKCTKRVIFRLGIDTLIANILVYLFNVEKSANCTALNFPIFSHFGIQLLSATFRCNKVMLSKPAVGRFGIERHPYTKSRIDQIPCVCVCNYSSQTTEPICIKIIPANRASYADCYRLLRFEIFIPTMFNTPKIPLLGAP